jgi:hypothetical protein
LYPHIPFGQLLPAPEALGLAGQLGKGLLGEAGAVAGQLLSFAFGA